FGRASSPDTIKRPSADSSASFARTSIGCVAGNEPDCAASPAFGRSPVGLDSPMTNAASCQCSPSLEMLPCARSPSARISSSKRIGPDGSFAPDLRVEPFMASRNQNVGPRTEERRGFGGSVAFGLCAGGLLFGVAAFAGGGDDVVFLGGGPFEVRES